jgi:alpha-galactosidase
MRALRSIPVFMEIIKEMEHICPGAWLINFTNPIGTLCRLANKVSSIKTIGVSNEFTGTYPFIKKALAVRDAALLTLKVGGINRLSWILDANYDRKDMLPEMKQHMERYAAKPRNNAEGGEESHYVKCELLRIFGYLPYAEDRKLAEMAPFFLTPETQRGEKYGVRLVNLKKLRSDLMSKKDKIEHAAASKNPVNFSKSTSDLADMVATLANRGEGTFVVNVPNRGSISNLPFDAVVEVFGYFNNRKVGEPVIGDLPTGILGITEPHVINQELVVEAALRGSRKIALRALLLDPLNRSITTAEKVFDQLLRAHKQYLPQFF